MDKNTLAQFAELRRLAEKRLASSPPPVGGDDIGMRRLLQELQMHQIELEMQNEDLHRTRLQVEAGLERYADLFDFAPIGYVALNRGGDILQVNLTGARILGAHRADLVGRRLGLFIAQSDLVVYNTFIEQAFATHTKQVCEVALEQPEGPVKSNCLFVRLESALSADDQECRLALIDITEHKHAVDALRASQQELRRSAQRLATLHALDQAILSAQAVEEIADMALRHLRQLIPYSAASVMEYDKSSAQWSSLAVRADTPAISARFASAELPPALIPALEQREYFLDNDLTLASGASLLELKPLPLGLRSHLVVPLHDQETLIGCLYLSAKTPDFMTDDYIEIAREVAAQIAAMIRKTRSNIQLRQHAAELERRVSERTTELQATVNALRAQEARDKQNQAQLQLQADLLNAVGQSVLALRLDNTLIYWNSYAEQLYGWKAEEVIGRHINDVLGTTTEERDIEVDRALRAGQVFTAEFIDRRKDGTRFPALASISPYYDPAGQLIGKISVTIDISERKQMEEQLQTTIVVLHEREAQKRQAEERLLLALRAGKVTTWEVDLATGNTSLMSGGNESSLSLQPVVLTHEQVIAGIHPDDREHVDAMTQQAVAADEEQSRIYRAVNLDGTMHWVLSSGRRVVGAAGASVKLVGAAIDITEQKYMQDRLHILFQHAPDPIVLFDKTWVLRDVNHAYEAMTGYTRAELIGMSPHDRGITTSDDPEITPAQREALLQGHTIPAYEVVLRSRSGEQIVVEKNIHAVTIDGESMYMAALRDISARIRSEAALRESMRALEEMNELKSRFVSTASHQFRTPLATILITTDNLRAYRHRMDDARIDGRLQKIQAEVGHMQKLVDDLLHLTRMQASGQALKPIMLDLDTACRDIVEQFQEDPALAHTLQYTSSEQPINALLDPKLLKDAIANLISNALKYSSTGTTVGIDLTASDARIVLRVSDQGIGIPADDLPRLFEPFHRAGNVGQIEGTGLGLSITKNAVELHGGTITAASEVGRGTTFTITLPRNVSEPLG